MDSCSTLAKEFATLMVKPLIVSLGIIFDSIVCFVNVLAAVAKLVLEFLLYTPEPAELDFSFLKFSGAVGKLFREFHFSNPTSAEMREWCLFYAFLSVPLSYLLFRLYSYPCDPDRQEEEEEVGLRVPALSTDRLDVFYFWRERHRDGGVYSRRRAAVAPAA
jgi:hypothetical protein